MVGTDDDPFAPKPADLADLAAAMPGTEGAPFTDIPHTDTAPMPFEQVDKTCPECICPECVCPPIQPCREPPMYHKMIPREHSSVIQMSDEGDVYEGDVYDDDMLDHPVKRRRRKKSKSMYSRRKPSYTKKKKRKKKQTKQKLKNQIKSLKKELGKLEKRKTRRKSKKRKSRKSTKKKRKSKSKSFMDEVWTN